MSPIIQNHLEQATQPIRLWPEQDHVLAYPLGTVARAYGYLLTVDRNLGFAIKAELS